MTNLPNLKVREIGESDRSRWDAFIARLLASGVDVHHAFSFHWYSILQNVFGHQPRYFVAEDLSSDRIVACIPLFYVRSVLFGSALISVPYLNAGGILTETLEAVPLLESVIGQLAAELRTNYVELRYRDSLNAPSANWTVRQHKLAMSLALPSNAESLFNSFPAKLRSQIRRPTKSGLVVRSTQNEREGEDLRSDFYGVFSRHMRDLGTPVYSRQLFREVSEKFGGDCQTFVVYNSDRIPVAGSMTVGLGASVEVPWASALKKFNTLSPNMLLYWEMMKSATSRGYQTFDFGRSTRDSGPHRFKQQWGASEIPLHWAYTGKVPDINPNSPKFAVFVKTWRNLPLPISQILGPRLSRSLP